MKKILLVSLILANFAFAEDTKTQEAPKAEPSKMTTRDAKKNCKDEGKKGSDLIQCMKEKKDEK